MECEMIREDGILSNTYLLLKPDYVQKKDVTGRSGNDLIMHKDGTDRDLSGVKRTKRLDKGVWVCV